MAKILIAGNDDDARAACRKVVESQRHKVRCEDSADAFIGTVSQFKPDLIILNARLPAGGAGDDLCRKIRKTPGISKLPILMFTDSDGEDDIRRSIESGADECVLKPVRDAELVTKLNLLLAKGARIRQFPLLAKGTFLGRYRLDEMVGRGDDCVSYLAIDVRCAEPKRLALKIFNRISQSEADRSSFLLEAETLGGLDHPGIARILDYGLTGEKIFVATEFVDGDSLGDLLRKSRVSESTAIIVAKEVVKALTYLNSKSMMHKNIRPNNIMISSAGEIKLVDFALKGQTTQNTLRINERMFGIIQFTAPERLGGDGVVSVKSDIFSLGLTLYYAVSGTLPLYSSNPMVMLDKYMREDPKPLKEATSGVSDEFSDLIDHMIAKKPEERHGIEEVTAVLDKLIPFF